MKPRELNHGELFVGLRVEDQSGDVGVIVESHDIHNVLVIFDKGGQGFYCLDKECYRCYEPLYESK